jgi:outer membrane lipoprotein-sorting protein
MLKLGDILWLYDPKTDRTIQISGNLLKQSVMGSDLSYEDFMEEAALSQQYNAKVTGDTLLAGRNCWVLALSAKTEKVSYPGRRIIVDKERYLPLYMELLAKSGKLLKTMETREVVKVQNRWYPKTIIYRDMLKSAENRAYGTEFRMDKIAFDSAIPDYIFSKASLKK